MQTIAIRKQRLTQPMLNGLLAVALTLVLTVCGYGQDTNASLSGSVLDPSGAAIPGTKLVLTNAATGFESTFVSNSGGEFTFNNLTPGTYNLLASSMGFDTSVQQGITLSINQAGRVDVRLKVGQEDQTITVSSDASLINYDNPTIEGGIPPETLNEMPLTVAGAPRSSISLATLMPGVSTGGTGSAFNARVNGGIVTGDEALLDGATMTEGFMNQSGMVALQGDFQMSPDMVSEVKVLSANYDPQYGSTTSGQLIVVSKGGGERFHGAGFEFLRNDYFNAFQYGTPKYVLNRDGTPSTVLTRISPDKENNYGANIGGPVWIPGFHGPSSKMKAYFYFNWEAFKDHGGASAATLSIASLAARSGNFSGYKDANGNMIPIYDPKTGLAFAGNQIPLIREDPITKAWIAAMPTPTNSGEINNYLVPKSGQGSLVNGENVYMSRVDLILGSSDHLYYTYWWQYSQPNLTSDLPTAISTAGPAEPENSPVQRMNWEHTFSDKMTNHLTVGYLNRNEGYYSLNLGAQLPTVTGVANSTFLPAFNFASQYSSLGSSRGPSALSVTTRPTYAINDVLTRVMGTHTLKAGLEWRNAGGNIHSGSNQGGTFTFAASTTGIPAITSGDAMASFFLGASSSANVAFLNVPNSYPRQIGWAAHVGDTWRVNSKLTATYGVRWDTISPSYEKNNNLSFFDPLGTNTSACTAGVCLKGSLAFAGTGHGAASYGKQYPEQQQYNWAPRVGFAYSPDEKTVVRAGYGIYYGQAFYPGWGGGISQDGFNLNDTIGEVRNNAGVTPALYLSNGFPTPASTSNLTAGFDNGQSPYYRPFDGNKRPYSSQWNLTIERQLPKSLFVSVSYVGTKGTHLPSQNNPINVLNPFNPTIQALGTHLRDTFGPSTTTLDGVSAPYASWYSQVNGNCGATVAQALLPFPQYCGTMTGDNEGHGNSIYESLQGKLERRFKGGLYILGSFTASSLYTNSSEMTQATNANSAGTGSISPYDPKRQRAIAADNVPYNGSVAVVYDLPFGYHKQFLNGGGVTNAIVGGWQVSPIWQFSHGIPFSFGSASCNVVPQFRQQCLPSIRSGTQVLLHSTHGFDPSKTGGTLINPAAFESDFSAFGYTGGGAPVTTIYGPSYRNTDMALTKNTKIAEKANLQFRASFFNAFNNHYFISGQGGNFGGVSYAFNTQVGSSGFGQWNGTVSAPRTIQFAARIEF
jgi:Carboxypeptidase regulatory-like domain